MCNISTDDNCRRRMQSSSLGSALMALVESQRMSSLRSTIVVRRFMIPMWIIIFRKKRLNSGRSLPRRNDDSKCLFFTWSSMMHSTAHLILFLSWAFRRIRSCSCSRIGCTSCARRWMLLERRLILVQRMCPTVNAWLARSWLRWRFLAYQEEIMSDDFMKHPSLSKCVCQDSHCTSRPTEAYGWEIEGAGDGVVLGYPIRTEW